MMRCFRFPLLCAARGPSASSSKIAPCVASLQVSLDNKSFWSEYYKQQKLQNQHVADPNAAVRLAAASAALDCMSSPYVASHDTALSAMRRWTSLDNDDSITRLIVSSKGARANLASAVVSHQQSVEFVAHACRAIANAALMTAATSVGSAQHDSTSKQQDDTASDEEMDAVTYFATNGVIPVILQTLLKAQQLLEVEDGRGLAWVLQALQNMILRNDAAAEQCALFSSAAAKHDTEATAEHHVSVALLRLLSRHRSDKLKNANDRETENDDDVTQDISVLQRRVVALDSGLACIARMLAMSVDSDSQNQQRQRQQQQTERTDMSNIQHRSERASNEVFQVVASALQSDLGQMSVEVQHKAWECLRQLVVTRDNIMPLLSALHAADGMSGMAILERWIVDTLEDLPEIFAEQDSDGLVTSTTTGGEAAAHDKVQRMLCGLDVLLELTAASVSSPSSSSSTADAADENAANDKPDLHNDGERRWDTTMNSITGGSLSRFAIQLIRFCHHHRHQQQNPSTVAANNNNNNDNNNNSHLRIDIMTRSMTLLVQLSQNDPFVRGANCLAVLQEAILKPTIDVLTDKNHKKQEQDVEKMSLLSAHDATMCQKTMSVIWNALNFTDALETIITLKLRDDVATLMAAAKSEVSDCDAGGGHDKKSNDARQVENMVAAAEKLLEKMKVVVLK